MAGAGYKLFNTGDVLTAAQVNTYLQEQTVMVFASSAARTSALSGVLAEGMVTYLQDTNAVEVYNGTAWVGVSGAGDITEVQAGTGISVASGTGPIPVITNTVATAFDAAGDLVYGTGADTFTKLSLGTAGKVLTVNSGATAPEWATPAGGGGLTFIKKQTVGSAVSSQEVTGAFSATYDNYLITFTGGASGSDNNDINITFGATTSGYSYNGWYQNSTSATMNTYAGDSTGSIGIGTMDTYGASIQIFVTSPYLAARTGVQAKNNTLASGSFRVDYAGSLRNTTSYTSFKLTNSASTMTGGEIRVYGFQNS